MLCSYESRCLYATLVALKMQPITSFRSSQILVSRKIFFPANNLVKITLPQKSLTATMNPISYRSFKNTLLAATLPFMLAPTSQADQPVNRAIPGGAASPAFTSSVGTGPSASPGDQVSMVSAAAGNQAAIPALDQEFITPPREAKPWTYWMWLGTVAPPEAITRDLEEFYAKGIVGVLIYSSSLGPVWYPEHKVVLEGKEYRKVETDKYGGKSAPTPFDRMESWSDEWRASVRFAAKEASRIGIDLGVAIGTTAPREFVSNEFEQQELKWSEASFTGPGLFNSALPVPEIKRSKTAKKPPFGEPYHRDIVVLAFPDKPVLESDEVIDLTAKMDARGHLRWDAPAGKWTIMRFAQVALQAGNAKSLHIDGLSTEAVDKAWGATIGRLLAEMTPEERKGLKFIEEDSWEAGNAHWTKTFAEEFNKRRGYDLLPYLPVLAGRVIGDDQIAAQIQQDYQLTIDDLIADNHYAYRRKLANEAGLPFYAETAGPNMKQSDALKSSSRVDVAMAEFWMPSPHRPTPERRFMLREAASANHIYGKKIMQCEAFTSVGPHWEESPFSMKATGDQAFCDGLNRVMFHTASLSPSLTAKPGYTMWASTHYEPGITWWNQTPAFNTYLSRCSYLLQQGLFAADALIYQGDKSGYSHVLKTILPTLGEGYDYDTCNTEVLLTRLSVKDGSIVLPDGMSYRVLVLPDNLPMQLPVLEQVVSLLNAGATVVGPRPTKMFGKPLQPGDREKFDALVNRLWGNPADQSAMENRLGAGRLAWGKTARQVLHELGVGPDFEYKGLSDAGTIDWIHRTLPDGTEIYFVTSRWETPESVEGSFRISGKQPELWNPVTGEMRAATAFRQENGRTMVPLEFDPCGSVFVIFRKAIGTKVSGTTASNYPTLKPRLELDGAWDVAFDPKWGGPAKVRFDALTDWTQHAEVGIKFYSGTAIYRKTFSLSVVPEKDRQLILDLGEVRELAEVRLNGKNLGVVWTRPARVNITNAVKAGDNKLEVSVVNLWPNRLIGDAALPPKERFTETNMRKFITTSPLLSSGLLGPVQILAEDASR